MYSGGLCTNWGEFVKSWYGAEPAKQLHLILLQVKLEYIPNILPLTGCPEKLGFRLQRGSMWAKSAFCHFFGFSNITDKLIILKKKNFVYLNQNIIETHLFYLSAVRWDNFQPNYNEKPAKMSNLRESSKPLKIYTKDGQRGTVSKLVVPLIHLSKKIFVSFRPPRTGCRREGGTPECHKCWICLTSNIMNHYKYFP